MSPARASRRHWLALAALALAGCATRAPGPVDGAGAYWSGRLLLRILDTPPTPFSAGFELQGSAEAGRLRLAGPLGQTLAEARWQPGGAELRRSDRSATEQYPDLDTLTRSLTGAVLPVAALFQWLAGQPTPQPGWSVDLSGLADGRLEARRLEPAPGAELRLRLD